MTSSNTKDTKEKSKINPVAVGATAVAAGVAGAAVAAMLSDRNTRKKVGDTLGVLKDQAMKAMDTLDSTATKMESGKKSDIADAVQKVNTTLQSGKETFASVKGGRQETKREEKQK